MSLTHDEDHGLERDLLSLRGIEVMGNHRILRLLGRGSLGLTYLARDECGDRDVALKVIVPDPFELGWQGGELKAVFLKIAGAARELDHENTLAVFGSGEEQGLLFVAEEYVDADNLRWSIATGSLSWEESVSAVLAVLSALDHAHAKGIVHGDLRPENVFLPPEGQLKVGGFGAAGLTKRGALTTAGMMTGAPGYLAPEQISGEWVDRRTDVFAAGVLLYELLTGRNPFAAESPAGILVKTATEEPPGFDPSGPDIPAGVILAVEKALRKDPNERYATAGEMRSALETALAKTEVVEAELEAALTVTAVPAAAEAGEDGPAKEEIDTTIDRGRNRNAQVALIFGIGAFSFFPVVGAVFAIVFGALARREIKRGEKDVKGLGMATAGLTLGILGLVIPALAALIFVGWDNLKKIVDEFFNWDLLKRSMPYLFRGLWVTIKLALVSEVFILIFGLIVALLRISKVKAIRAIAAIYIDVVRGIPLILQIVVVYYGLVYLGIKLDQFTAAVMALTICYAAYEAEIFRAGIESIHKGQMEAARSLGMGYVRAMWSVILPQAVRRVIPPLSNEFIALTKDTALVSVIALSEVFLVGKEIMGRFYNTTPMVGAALCYLIVTIPLMRGVQYMEKRLQRGD